MKKILSVPTHIIAGFLGVGKTTAILHLFKQKSAHEKWAVLVNEFGKMGIDRHFYQAQDIYVEEIPGGCMCCAQGLPLQVAVNRLLKSVHPDRLIVETSGIGHAEGIIKTFSGEHFRQSLNLKAVISLLNPEYLLNQKYLSNDLFIQQIEVADLLVANKIDLASTAALKAFDVLFAHKNPQATVKVQQGQLDLALLNRQRAHQHPIFNLTKETLIHSHWHSYSYQMGLNEQLNTQAFIQHASQLPFQRIKGLVQTDKGLMMLNGVDKRMHFTVFNNSENQRINTVEVIAETLDESQWDNVFKLCIRHD